MKPVFSFFHILIIIGIVHGFVISLLIWVNSKKSLSKVLLSLVLTVFNLLCLKILILTTGIWQLPYGRYLPLSFELAIQPLLWLYISSIIKAGFQFNKKHLLHFIPFLCSMLYSVYVYLAVIRHPGVLSKDVIANHLHFNKVKEIEDYCSVVSSVLYWWLGFRLVSSYRRWLYNNVSATNYPTYAWLKNVAVLTGILIALLFASVILDYFFHFGVQHFIHWQIFFVYLAALIYYLGFRGYRLQERAVQPGKDSFTEQATVITKDEKGNEEDVNAEGFITKTQTEIRLPEQKIKLIKEAIVIALEEKELYLNPELNLEKLAKEINSSPSSVSAVINSSFQKSFRNLVNEYRVKKVKLRLSDPASNNFSILGIAYECGFNSEASFYRIFKAETGISPKEYMKGRQSSE